MWNFPNLGAMWVGRAPIDYHEAVERIVFAGNTNFRIRYHCTGCYALLLHADWYPESETRRHK